MIEPRAHLRDLVRIDSADIRGDFIRLDRNERISPMPEDLFRDILSSLTPDVFSSYPDPKTLNDRLATHVGLPEGWAIATNGSDATIRRAFHAFVGPGDPVVYADPTYAMYSVYTQIFQGTPVVVSYGDDRRLDVDAYLEAIDAGARLICVVNPDQPTGATMAQSDLRRVIEAAHARDAVCMVDEAYYPCHPETAVAWVRDFDNLIVSRSFSKVGGLGGLRLGYFCAQPSLVEALNKTRGLHEVNAMAIAVGGYLLDHPQIMEDYRRTLEDGRAVIQSFARARRLGCPPCPTNFQLIEFPASDEPKALVERLKQRGFLVKGGFSNTAVRRCLRVTLDGPDLMRDFVATLDTVLDEIGVAAT